MEAVKNNQDMGSSSSHVDVFLLTSVPEENRSMEPPKKGIHQYWNQESSENQVV